jgi:sorbitol-specific phosphotransferase system component IIBC
VLLTYGDQPSSVIAAVDVLIGATIPTGRLPVHLADPPAESRSGIGSDSVPAV